MKSVLIISASDSIAGAGMQTDLKTCTLLQTYATTCLTAITAQNTGEVRAVLAIPADMIKKQLDCILEDTNPEAIKIGLLGSIAAVDIVSEIIQMYNLKNIILDPVLVATCGDGLLAKEDEKNFPDHLARKLFPLSLLVTPNLREASELSGIDAIQFPYDAAKVIIEKYRCKNVLLKGGDGNGTDSVDLLISSTECVEFKSERIDTSNSHGTGCTLSSAIASYVSKGYNLYDAIKLGKEFVLNNLRQGKDITFGTKGYGPTILSYFK